MARFLLRHLFNIIVYFGWDFWCILYVGESSNSRNIADKTLGLFVLIHTTVRLFGSLLIDELIGSDG